MARYESMVELGLLITDTEAEFQKAVRQPPVRITRWTQGDWVDLNWDMLSVLYRGLLDHCDQLSAPMMDRADFGSFCLMMAAMSSWKTPPPPEPPSEDEDDC